MQDFTNFYNNPRQILRFCHPDSPERATKQNIGEIGGDRSERENRRYQAALAKAQAKRSKLETKQQLSISDAARLLNVIRPTIYRLIDEGTLSPIRISPRSVRIPREQLQNLIPESKADSGNPPLSYDSGGSYMIGYL